MKLYRVIIPVLLVASLVLGCEVTPQQIAYGETNCVHCQMTVSDSRFGAEVVTTKGKAYFFDSAECLASYLQANPEKQQDAELVLVTDFSKPNQLIDVKRAAFLQSKNLPSPMGMFLSAFPDKAKAEEYQQKLDGRVLTWEQAMLAVEKNDRPY